MIDLRPLSLGEIVDRSASFWRNHWRPLFKLYLGFQLGEFVLLKGWELVTRRYFPLVGTGGQKLADALASHPAEAFRQLGGSFGLGGVVMLIYLLTGFFSGIAGSFYAWPRMLGRTVTLSESLDRAVARLGVTFRFFLLMLGWTALVGLLFLLPGMVLMLLGALTGDGVATAVLVGVGALGLMAGMLLTLLWFIVRFVLAAQILALEDLGALGVFRRCDALASGRIGDGLLGFVKVRLTVLITVVTLIISMVSLLFGIPALVIQGIYGHPFDPMHATPDAIPQTLMVPAQLLQVIAQSVVGPLWVVFGVVFYADMRVRREGLDLELKLKDGPA